MYTAKKSNKDVIREATIHTAKLDHLDISIIIIKDRKGLIKEVQIKTQQHGSLINGMLDSMSKLISRMLEYDINPIEIIDILKGQRFEPRGSIIGHSILTECSSILDLIARVIELEYNDCNQVMKVI